MAININPSANPMTVVVAVKNLERLLCSNAPTIIAQVHSMKNAIISKVLQKVIVEGMVVE